MARAGAVIAAVIAYPIGHSIDDRQGYNRRIAEQAVADTKAEPKGRAIMRKSAAWRIMISALLLSSVVGCQSSPATSCAGFSLNNLSAAGTVALIKADRSGFNRVEANDRNFERRKCGG